VYLTSRDEGRGEAAVEELKKLGFQPHYHQLDIDDESSVLRFKNFLKSKYEGLDVLVNNAAIAFKNAAPEPFCEQATLTMRTNFFNTYRFCNIIFPILKPHARVVNVSSSAGHLLKIPGDHDVAVALRKKLSSSDLTGEELVKMIEGFVKYVLVNTKFEMVVSFITNKFLLVLLKQAITRN
jgi:carbonyl reductase 1